MPDLLTQLRAAATAQAKATPGPYRNGDRHHTADYSIPIYDANCIPFAFVSKGRGMDWLPECGNLLAGGVAEATAEFIAAAGSFDFAALVDRVERLEAVERAAAMKGTTFDEANATRKRIPDMSVDELRAALANALDHWLHADFDAAYYSCLVDGSWPDADAVIADKRAALTPTPPDPHTGAKR